LGIIILLYSCYFSFRYSKRAWFFGELSYVNFLFTLASISHSHLLSSRLICIYSQLHSNPFAAVVVPIIILCFELTYSYYNLGLLAWLKGDGIFLFTWGQRE